MTSFWCFLQLPDRKAILHQKEFYFLPHRLSFFLTTDTVGGFWIQQKSQQITLFIWLFFIVYRKPPKSYLNFSGSEQLSGRDRELNGDGADLNLKQALKPIVQNYDYIIIDTPPALGILTINAFTAADRVIIPAQADIYSLQGIGQLYRTIKAVQEHTNPNLKIAGILITRYNGRTILTRDLSELINQTAQQLNTKVFEWKIRESIVIKEAQASNKSIFEYSAESSPAKDYDRFMKELLEDIQI